MKRSLAVGLTCASVACSDGGSIQRLGEAPPSPSQPSPVKIEGEVPMNVDGAAVTPPEALRLLEFAIPGVLENCGDGAPFPHDPAVDTETGLVYYTDSTRHCIGEFNPETLEFRAWPTATAGAEPHGLVVVDGVVYYTGWVANILGRVDPIGGTTEDFPLAVSDPHTPTWQRGAVWFTGGARQYGRFDPVTTETQLFDFSSDQSGPYGIAPAPDGSLWVALFGTNRLARIDTGSTPASAEEFVLPATAARPRRLAVDAQGKVWYSNYAGRELGLMDPSAPEGQRFRQFPTPRGGRPYGIAIGPDGRVWYGDQDAAEVVGFDPASESVVAELPISTAGPGPLRNMAADPEHQRIWISLSDVGVLGVIQF
jgi:virginiamycin B lyase